MIDYSNRLVDFLKEKDELIYKTTDIHLYDSSDYDEISEWTQSECRVFLENLNDKGDMDICPWCKKYLNSHCVSCKYKDRHIQCQNQDSLNRKILLKLNHSISKISGMSEIISNYKL